MQSGTPIAASRALGVNPPLSERILARSGSRRWLWIAIWASTALVAPVVLLALLGARAESDRVLHVEELLLGQIVLAYAVALCLWGAGRLDRGARALEPDLARITADGAPRASIPPLATLAGPILLTAVVSAVNTAGSWSRYGPLPALAILPLIAVSLLGIMAFVWTYLELLVGLDRLGRGRLALRLFPQDRSLGLRGVGSLAFAGFVILFAAAVPIAVTGTSNVVTVSVSVAVVATVVVLFFLSMTRLHRQMAAAKVRYVAETRAALEAAYAPLATGLTVEGLDRHATALGAAQALADRAERILVWPVDEAMTAWVAVIATGVVTSLAVRLIFAAAGLG